MDKPVTSLPVSAVRYLVALSAVCLALGIAALAGLFRIDVPTVVYALLFSAGAALLLLLAYTLGRHQRPHAHGPDDTRAREERFRLFVEAAPNAMIVVNAGGLIELINSQTEAWFGYRREALIGKPVELLVPDYMREPPARSIGAARELYGRRQDGSEFPIEIVLNPIQSDQGTLVLSAIIDISERRAAERRMQEQAEQIAAASRYKSEFLANMSHELRTPLNSILLLAEQLRENRQGNLTVKQVEHASIVYRSGSDLLTLINDILDLSKIEAGRMSVSTEKVLINHFVEELRLAFTPLADERGIKFSVSVADAPAVVVTDRHRMYQIVRNLVSNALKFTEAGMVHVRIFTPRHDVPPDMASTSEPLFAVSVTDTGPGIPKDKQQTIFEAFRQLDASLSRQHGGTGLGLTISRQIADLLGGVITVTSQVGLGSTFTLYLPARATVAQRDSERETRFSTIAKSLRGPVPRVLIVEDDADFAHLLATIARDHDAEPVVVSTAAGAMKQARHAPPDAVILDISLPDTSGWSLLEQLRKLPAVANAPVYVISSADNPHPGNTFGIRDYFVKPVDKLRLVRLFENLRTELLKSARLLLLADQPETRERLDRFFGARGFQVTSCVDVTSAEMALARGGFRVLVVDAGATETVEHVVDRLLSQSNDDLKMLVHANGAGPALRRRLADLGAILLEGEASDDAWSIQVDNLLTSPVTATRKAPHRVLVVDDDVRNTYALCSTFEDLNVEVVAEYNGAEALERVRREKDRIDMVFMDIAMPVMDGYETTRRLKDEVHYAGPVIALTAYAMKGDREKCIAAGADDYVAKPVSRADIIRLLDKWLGSTQSEDDGNANLDSRHAN